MKSILKNTESKNHPEGITTESVSEERKKPLKEKTFEGKPKAF